MSIIPHTSSRSLQAALRRVNNPPNGTHYEHHVSTWAATMLKKVFHSDEYTLTSEVIDPHEKSKPDFLIEILTPENELVRHLYVELKKIGGDHFEKALDQATRHIRATIETESSEVKECFVVVQRGLDIGFFEFHARQEDLEAENIPNFRSCVSLTQSFNTEEDMPFTSEDLLNDPYGQEYDPMDKIHSSLSGYVVFDDKDRRVIIPELPSDIKVLSYGNYSGQDSELVQIRKDAEAYTTPCVFNIQQHESYINYLFHYMSVQTPRKLVPNP